jgi:ubiquitin-like 1-activating enzyme E1 A
MKAQTKIRSANILLVTIKGLGNEIAKNLVLAGIGSLTIHDNAIVSEDDLCSQFFLAQEDIGRFVCVLLLLSQYLLTRWKRATAAATPIQALNPRVMIHVETRDIFSLPVSYFNGFDMIIGTDMSIQSFNVLNANARMSAKAFYAAGSHGLYGFVFADLIKHNYYITRDKSNIVTKPGPETATRSVIGVETEVQNGKVKELVEKEESYQPLILANTSPLPNTILSRKGKLKKVMPLLPCMRALWEFEKSSVPPRSLAYDASPADIAAFTALAQQTASELSLPSTVLTESFISSFVQNLYSELSPVCAFLGAQLAQDVINVLGSREQPIQNMLLFDGMLSQGEVYALYPLVPSMDAGMATKI